MSAQLEVSEIAARVLNVVQALALEARAGFEACPTDAVGASLQRDWGFGSLELIELHARMGAAFGPGSIPDFFALDSVADIARALAGVSMQRAALHADTDRSPHQPSQRHALDPSSPPRAEPALATRRYLYTAYATVVVALASALFWFGGVLAPAGARSRAFTRRVTRFALRALGARLSLTVDADAKLDRPVVLVSNHTSFGDVPTLVSMLPKDFVFVAKHEVTEWPIIGRLTRKSGHIPVDRDDLQSCLRAAHEITDVLRRGTSVLVFPESTFVPGPGIRRFRLGAFASAVEAGVPVVPVGLLGSREFLRPRSRVPLPAAIRVWVGAPILPEGHGFAAAAALRERVAQRISERIGEPRIDEFATSVRSKSVVRFARRGNLARSVLHASFGLIVASSVASCARMDALRLLEVLALSLAISAWSVELARRFSPLVNRIAMAVFRHVAHAHEWSRVNSATWYVTATWLLIRFEEARTASVAILVLAIADPIAAIVGRRFGTRKLHGSRTVEGTFAFVLSAFVAALSWRSLWFAEAWSTSAVIHAGCVALFGACAELYSGSLDDNLTIPIASALGARCGNLLTML